MLFDEATSALDHENEDNFKERTSQPRKNDSDYRVRTPSLVPLSPI